MTFSVTTACSLVRSEIDDKMSLIGFLENLSKKIGAKFHMTNIVKNSSYGYYYIRIQSSEDNVLIWMGVNKPVGTNRNDVQSLGNWRGAKSFLEEVASIRSNNGNAIIEQCVVDNDIAPAVLVSLRAMLYGSLSNEGGEVCIDAYFSVKKYIDTIGDRMDLPIEKIHKLFGGISIIFPPIGIKSYGTKNPLYSTFAGYINLIDDSYTADIFGCEKASLNEQADIMSKEILGGTNDRVPKAIVNGKCLSKDRFFEFIDMSYDFFTRTLRKIPENLFACVSGQSFVIDEDIFFRSQMSKCSDSKSGSAVMFVIFNVTKGKSKTIIVSAKDFKITIKEK